MKRRNYYPWRAPLHLAAHAAGLRRIYPQGSLSATPERVRWEGWVQPLEDSRLYKLRLDCALQKIPAVFVLSPNLLDVAQGQRLPHVYDQQLGHLCLFHPQGGNWKTWENVATTVMPWALTWLVFFEIWMATGIWHGRAIGHPGDDPDPRVF